MAETDGPVPTRPPNMTERPGLEQLVIDFHQPLYRYAFRLSGSVADAEDLTQQVFLIAQQKMTQVRESQNLRAWLFTVLRNCYLKICRRQVPLPAASLELDIDGVAEELEISTFDEERLQQALDELADEFKLVVLMFYFEEQSYREIAEALEVPIGTVMSRLSRAKSHLRRRMSEDEGVRLEGARREVRRKQKQGHEV